MALRLWKGSVNSDCAWQHTVDGKVIPLIIFSIQEKENAEHGVDSGILRIRFWWRNKEEKALHGGNSTIMMVIIWDNSKFFGYLVLILSPWEIIKRREVPSPWA